MRGVALRRVEEVSDRQGAGANTGTQVIAIELVGGFIVTANSLAEADALGGDEGDGLLHRVSKL